MAITPPSNYTYGTVVGRFIKQIADTADDVDRHFDLIPSTGTVTFTPSVSYFKNLAMPATFITEPIVCTIDSNGYLVDPLGATGVVLLATDHPDISPSGWTYSVSLSINGKVLPSFSISVVGGSTVDLTTVMPAAISAGTVTITSEAARIETEALRDEVIEIRDDLIENPPGGGVDDDGIATLISGTSATRTSLDVLLNAIKAGTTRLVVKNEGAGTWPARPTGWARVEFYGTDPGPSDIAAGDLRTKPVA
jgi:hypothetical protein